jgi:ribokinase
MALDRQALGDAAIAAALTISRKGTRSAFPSIAELSSITAGLLPKLGIQGP